MMKKIIVALLFFSVNSNAYIFESNTLTSVLECNPTPSTLVIFDIDNTLAHPIAEFGSDEWFCHKIAEKMQLGFDYITSVYYTLPATYYAHFNLPLELVENTTPDLIAYLINNGIAVMALSTRSLSISERTIEQLDQINIHLFMPMVNVVDL